jgi:lipopolysaccharide/colanic/teichoic acid biosynthesis glycosyltransferase
MMNEARGYAELPKRRVRFVPFPFQKGGYAGYSKWSTISIPMFNLTLSILLIIFGIPIFLLIAFIIKAKVGGPIFYTGVRLGINKRPFTMYKFRTLPVGIQKITEKELYSYKHGRLPFISKFLRETRLDELPQLFNILKFEMDFIGPRPERPEIYKNMCKEIKDYDLRFVVRPGLIGYSQLFTPHSSPKRIRTLIDNRSVSLKRSVIWDVVLILLTIFVVFKIFFKMLFEFFWKNIVKIEILRLYTEKRSLDRIRQKEVRVSILAPCKKKEEGNGVLADINEEYFKMLTKKRLESGEHLYLLQKNIYMKRKTKRKVVVFKGDIFKVFESDKGNYVYIIRYEPLTPLNRYLVDQYFLNKSMVKFFC